jgi:hypothetical protein
MILKEERAKRTADICRSKGVSLALFANGVTECLQSSIFYLRKSQYPAEFFGWYHGLNFSGARDGVMNRLRIKITRRVRVGRSSTDVTKKG